MNRLNRRHHESLHFTVPTSTVELTAWGLRLNNCLASYASAMAGVLTIMILNGLYNSYVLLAVPLFVLAANLMNAGTISERIFDFCRILVGRLRGGLAQVDILVSVVFSGMSGSAIADAAGPGLVTIKQMLKKPEYSPGFAGAVVVASATIGPIIPPSIPMVLYALVSGAS